MEIIYSNVAYNSLLNIVNFVENNNTKGAGLRWLNKYENFLYLKMSFIENIYLSKNKTFEKLKLKCIEFNNWIIAFNVSSKIIKIEVIIHKSRIVD